VLFPFRNGSYLTILSFATLYYIRRAFFVGFNL
jgi:hypothetical protein